MSLTEKLHCRFCHAPIQYTFVDLGMSPICNNMIKPAQLNHMEPYYPLYVYVCGQCYLVQLMEFVSPRYIFDDYTYFSSFSDSWLQHAARYVEMAIQRYQLTPANFVVEIASNDGYLLRNFVAANIPCLGVEPAPNVAEVATQKGISTLNKFFGMNTAIELAAEGRQADLIIGNNVLAHVPDINDFVQGLKILLKPGGTINIEFPHLMRLIAENQFDTIYHEHFFYLSFTVVETIFQHHGLKLYHVEEVPTHGGSLRIYSCHSDDATKAITPEATELWAREKAAGYTQVETYLTFGEQVKATKRKLLTLLNSLKEQGKTIVGYGAPGKGNTLLNYCGVGKDYLDYTVDRSPYKQANYLPGTHIPVHEPDRIKKTKPDYVLILPWNLKDEITQQLAYIREWGGQFIVPIPEATIL
jgi:SAM-dependent methyltransferase